MLPLTCNLIFKYRRYQDSIEQKWITSNIDKKRDCKNKSNTYLEIMETYLTLLAFLYIPMHI